MGDIQLSATVAEVYESFFVPALFAEWPDRVLAAAGVGAGERVLDVACGTGILARTAMARVGAGGEIVGLDLNQGMLDVARRMAPMIDWRHGRAEALPFAAESFDVVVSQFGLMFFQDGTAALSEMMRVLRPGGRLAIAVWGTLDATPGYAAMVDLLVRLFGEDMANGLRAPYNLGDTRALRAELQAAGLPGATIATEVGTARFPSIDDWVYTDIRGWVLADRLDDQQFQRLLHSARHELNSFVVADGTVAFAAPAHIATAVKHS